MRAGERGETGVQRAARLQRRHCHRNSAVSVAVRLHYGHDACRARYLGDVANVVPQRGEVNVHTPFRYWSC